MIMKHYVLGFLFNSSSSSVLLVEKKRPAWQAGRYNGIGGKIDDDETPLFAMQREAMEKIDYTYEWEHAITFTCPGGTVFVFKAMCEHIEIGFKQIEDEKLAMFGLKFLPNEVMGDLRWMIPLCLSTVQMPIILQQNQLGII